MAFKKGHKVKVKASPTPWEDVLERGLKITRFPSRSSVYASNASLCERQTAGLMQLPHDRSVVSSASTKFYFKIGNAFEDLVEEAFRNEGVFVAREVSVSLEGVAFPTRVAGRIDFVVKGLGGRGLKLVELKSCGNLPARPKPSHLAQLLTYLNLTGMSSGLIWYISRRVSDYTGQLFQKVFEVKPTSDELLDSLYKMCLGIAANELGILPPIPSGMKRYKCAFCPLIPHCWDGDDFNLGRDPSVTDMGDITAIAKETSEFLFNLRDELRKEFVTVTLRT